MYNGGGNYNSGGNYTNIGGFRIKPIYLYIAGAVAVLVVIYFVMRFFSAGLLAHYGAFAGLLLLIGNLRELIAPSAAQRGSTALLNVLIGGGLICAWLAAIIGAVMWIPALILIGIAAPLIFGQATVYRKYIGTAQAAADSVRRTLIR
ncbi:MAG: hypothetical protein HC822_27300 [Oscillochloris sp.]|nr:hypothetical protein [Oscillochloris sp.]